MFEDGFGFERYSAWLIEHVPMYFVYRDGAYIDVAGQSFADFMAGRIPALAGETATLGDFKDHLTIAFTDVRLKRFLEMRGADAGRADMMLAQSALWVGLLYDDAALASAEALLRGAGWEDAVAARAAVPRQGLAAPWRGGTLRDIAADVVTIAKDGLRARGLRDAAGNDEQVFLAPLQEIAEGCPTQAEHWLAQYHGPWRGDASRIFAEAAI
jgi:glutamate--cysteine ligase